MQRFPGIGLISLIVLLAPLAAEAQPYYAQVYFKGSQGFLLSDSGRLYRSQDGGGQWRSCSWTSFAERVSLPETWLFCSGDHQITVVSEDEAH